MAAQDLNNNAVKLKSAPAKFRSAVWSYFGFRGTLEDSKTTCKLCLADVSYNAGNTTNMKQHLERHHKISVGDKIKSETPPAKKTHEPLSVPKSAVAGQLRIADALTACTRYYMFEKSAINNFMNYILLVHN